MNLFSLDQPSLINPLTPHNYPPSFTHTEHNTRLVWVWVSFLSILLIHIMSQACVFLPTGPNNLIPWVSLECSPMPVTLPWLNSAAGSCGSLAPMSSWNISGCELLSDGIGVRGYQAKTANNQTRPGKLLYSRQSAL